MKPLKTIIIIILLSIIIFPELAYAGRKKDFRERMKSVRKVAVLPLDYELIVPTAMHSDKQRKGFSDEETHEKRNLRVSQFMEKFEEYLKKKGYDIVLVNPEAIATADLIDKMQNTRGSIQEKIGGKEQEVFLGDDMKAIANQIPEIMGSDVFIVPLCRDRMATGGEALTRSFGMLGYMAGAESWKDEYAGYVPWATYTYVHAFVIDSKTFEVVYLLSAIMRDSMYSSRSVAIGLANEMSQQFPKRKGKEMPYWY